MNHRPGTAGRPRFPAAGLGCLPPGKTGMSESPPTRQPTSIGRRLGCAAGIALWLFFMILPIFFFQLIFNGQVEFGDDPQNQTRIFLLQESGQEGLGLQWTRQRRENPLCLDTAVYYLMFAGSAENSRSCTCLGEPGAGGAPAGCSVP